MEKPDAKIITPAKHPLELMLDLAKEAVASGSPAAQQFTEQLDEIGSPTHGARRHATQAALSQLSQPAAPFARPLLHALYSPCGERVRPALTLLE